MCEHWVWAVEIRTDLDSLITRCRGHCDGLKTFVVSLLVGDRDAQGERPSNGAAREKKDLRT